MMYCEKYNVVDLIDWTIDGIATGMFKDFGFAVADYLYYKDFMSEDCTKVKSLVKDKRLIAASMASNTTLKDVIDWVGESGDFDIVVVDYHILDMTKATTDMLDDIYRYFVDSLGLFDLKSYESRFAFCKKNENDSL